MTWIHELEAIMTMHLMDNHNDMSGMVQEVDLFTQFLVYSKFEEDEHTINCPMCDCEWEFKFEIKYQMNYDGGQES